VTRVATGAAIEEIRAKKGVTRAVIRKTTVTGETRVAMIETKAVIQKTEAVTRKTKAVRDRASQAGPGEDEFL